MTTESLDTSVVMRAALDLGDSQTAQACALLAEPTRLYSVSLVVIAESMHALVRHYGLGRTEAGEVLRWILDFPSLVCDRGIVLAALVLFESHPKLSFEDCLIAEQASADHATPLWTFDAKLAKQHPAARLVTG